MRSLRRGLAQFFGSDEMESGGNVDAENLCLTPSEVLGGRSGGVSTINTTAPTPRPTGASLAARGLLRWATAGGLTSPASTRPPSTASRRLKNCAFRNRQGKISRNELGTSPDKASAHPARRPFRYPTHIGRRLRRGHCS